MNRSRKVICLINIAIILTGCNKPKSINNLTIIKENGYTFIGKCDKDSLFEGKVLIFDSLNNNIGYSTYLNGIKNGSELLYHKQNIKSDSINYYYGYKDGFAYKYDSLGNLQFRVQYYRGIPYGSTTVYNKSGAITDYYFSNLDGKSLYRIKPLNDSVYKESGKVINFQISPINTDGKNKLLLSLYLLDNPFFKTHYAIGVLDEHNNIIKSESIVSKVSFIQMELNPLSSNEKYAIIYYHFNSAKGRDDMIIHFIE